MALSIGRAALLVGAVALLASACAQLLGDHFVIGEDGAGGGAGGVGGSGQGGGGGSGGGTSQPFVCDWLPGTIREIESLEGLGDSHWHDDLIAVSGGSAGMRLMLVQPFAVGPDQIELRTLSSSGDSNVEFSGVEMFDIKRVDGDTVAAAFRSEGSVAPGDVIEVMVVDDSDTQGQNLTTTPIMNPIVGFTEWDVDFAPVGNGNPSFVGDLVFVYSLLSQGARTAYVHYWDNTLGFGSELFSDPSLGKADFVVQSVNRTPGGVVVHLGTGFDGAPVTRVFEVPDNFNGPLAPTQTVPANPSDPAQQGDLFVSAAPRSTGDVGTLFARVDPGSGTLDALMGISAAPDLALHTIDDATVAGNLGPQSAIPSKGTFVTTDDTVSVSGTTTGNPDAINFVLLHRTAGIRFNGPVPFPEPNALPANRTIDAVAHVINDEALFDQLGGDIAVAWLFDVDGTHHRLYYGELNCSAAQN